MNFIKTTIAAAVIGFSFNAVAAVHDISDVTHGSVTRTQSHIGGSQPSWSDVSAVTQKGAREEVKPIAKSAGNYRFSDISKVTHN
jgi:hypothetical protein